MRICQSVKPLTLCVCVEYIASVSLQTQNIICNLTVIDSAIHECASG